MSIPVELKRLTAPPPAGATMRYGEATPPDGEFASVSARHRHTCGVRTDGSVACWGNDESMVEATPPDGEFESVSAGYSTYLRGED